MGHLVYRFGAVLRELRRDAGLTILAAADATACGNYERWESGQTRVGALHLRAIAEVFAVRSLRTGEAFATKADEPSGCTSLAAFSA